MCTQHTHIYWEEKVLSKLLPNKQSFKISFTLQLSMIKSRAHEENVWPIQLLVFHAHQYFFSHTFSQRTFLIPHVLPRPTPKKQALNLALSPKVQKIWNWIQPVLSLVRTDCGPQPDPRAIRRHSKSTAFLAQANEWSDRVWSSTLVSQPPGRELGAGADKAL